MGSELDLADNMLSEIKQLFAIIKGDEGLPLACARTLQGQLREIGSYVVACRELLDTE